MAFPLISCGMQSSISSSSSSSLSIAIVHEYKAGLSLGLPLCPLCGVVDRSKGETTLDRMADWMAPRCSLHKCIIGRVVVIIIIIKTIIFRIIIRNRCSISIDLEDDIVNLGGIIILVHLPIYRKVRNGLNN